MLSGLDNFTKTWIHQTQKKIKPMLYDINHTGNQHAVQKFHLSCFSCTQVFKVQ